MNKEVENGITNSKRENQYKEKPHSYALIESKKALFGDSISGTRILGDEQELEKITREEVAKEYEDMLENSHCEILIIGDLDMDKVVSIIKKNFYKPSIPLNQIPFVVENKIQPYHELEVESNYHQTQLLLYYLLEVEDRIKTFLFAVLKKILLFFPLAFLSYIHAFFLKLKEHFLTITQ